MKRLYLVLIFSCVLSGIPAFADESASAEEPVLTPKTQGEVRFVSGGVGYDEQQAMQAMRADYNLSLLFSVRGGEYLSNVDVRVTDLSGNTLLKTVSDGPKLFAKLKPGRYVVTVERDGQTLRRTVTVGGRQGAAVSFVWPQ